MTGMRAATGGSRREIILGRMLLLTVLAAVLVLSACADKAGKEANPAQQTTNVSQDGEKGVTDPSSDSTQGEDERPLSPFTYEISRSADADPATWERGIRDYVLAGETHAYHVTFSHPVDHASVESQGLVAEGLEVEYDWHSDSAVTVRLRWEDTAATEEYGDFYFGFGHARAADGLARPVQEDHGIFIQPTRPKTFAFFDPSTGNRDTFLKSLISYTRLDRSPSGKDVLAEETAARESFFVYHYTLLDREGNRLMLLDAASPVWLRDDDVLLYRKDRSIVLYDVGTGLEQVVWAASAPVEWVYFDYHAPSGKLVVVTLHENEKRELEGDLYLHEQVTDREPRVFRDVFRDSGQYMGVYPEGVKFIDGDKLFVEYIENRDTYHRERRVMDWTTGELIALEPADDMLPLTRGSVLKHAEGKWQIVGLADDGAQPLAVDDGQWYRAIPVNEDWVALIAGGDAADLLHVPTASIHAMKERLMVPFPWSGEAAYSIPELNR